MDYSNESYVHEAGSFPYDPEPFYTDQMFDSREELTDWAQTVARSLGYVIITKRSHKNTRGDVCSVLLRCDRSGVYEGKGSTSSRATSTRKINCPFKLVGQLSNYGWRLVVKDHNHNHPPAEYLEGHSFARRLSTDEKELVERLANLELPPRDIFAQLKAQFPANVSTIKDVYNALQVIKDKKAAEVGSTPMQVMLTLLHENNYSYDFTQDDANRLENLFFVHPRSFELWRVFPHVLIIDATYKTNIYNMPFVEIVGVTSTRKTFKVASAFITNEREDTYKWVLECLKQTLGGGMSVRVIITDRELALMNACRDIFPQAARLLCRFHIMQKIIDHVKPKFHLESEWGSFLGRWQHLIQSRTHAQYNLRGFQLHQYLESYRGAYKYLDQTWLRSYKEMFVSYWVDQHPNFGNYTTNRVESEHALLKAHLRNKSTFDRLLGCIDQIVKYQVTAIKESFETSKIKIKHEHNLPILRHLHGVVSVHALEIIRDELIRLHNLEDLSGCGCKLVTSCGLPCACQLSQYMNNGDPVPLESINPFWRKLNFSPSATTHDDDASDMGEDDTSVDEVLAEIKETYKKQSPPVKKSWMRKLKGFFSPGKSELKDPVVQTKTRGRPSVKKQSWKKDLLPDLNKTPHQSQEPLPFSRSRSMHSEVFERSPGSSNSPGWGTQSGRYSSYVQTSSRFDHTSSQSEISIAEIPKVFHRYVRRIVNVDGDGNCGFRALAAAMGFDQHNWYEWVRAEMLTEYEQHKDFYENRFSAGDRIYQRLQFSGTPRPFGLWMQIPEAGVLIANRFGMIVILISLGGSSTVFPFWVGPNGVAEHRVISIALVHDARHYVMLDLASNCPMPVITPYWTEPRNTTADARGWEDVYRDRLDHYNELTRLPPVHVDLSDDS